MYKFLVEFAACLALAACAGAKPSRDTRSATIGLFTTLPVLWAESGDLRGLLRNDAPSHWALAPLRARGELSPVETLLPGPAGPPLAGVDLLVMAQPRALAPQENVALDSWVRRGGHLLLFADPLLTEHSAYPIGDRRRPQDVALLSPILARWGLRLEFDEDQHGGERLVAIDGITLPVDLPGRFAQTGEAQSCELLADGIAARCRIGKGAVLAIADAALLDKHRATGREPLARLLAGLAGHP